jgi:hypothetical protein
VNGKIGEIEDDFDFDGDFDLFVWILMITHDTEAVKPG